MFEKNNNTKFQFFVMVTIVKGKVNLYKHIDLKELTIFKV